MTLSERDNIRQHFRAPEGVYRLHSEKVTGLVSFLSQRSTRLTVASLRGGNEEGEYIILNVGDTLQICPLGGNDKEPLRSLQLNTPVNKNGFPTCHAYQTAPQDGADLLVGLGTGEVLLMSLRAQLQNVSANSKPIITTTYAADSSHDSPRCNAVAWLPRSDGTQFVVGTAAGNLLMYKKGHGLAELTSRFSLSLGSKSSGPSPQQTIAIGGGGVQDVAFSPDGLQLAVACRDGALRVVDVSSGNVVAGFKGYYGSLLCCTFSDDGRYIATGGEDDLVTVYCTIEKRAIAWGEGHSSYVSRVVFDPWAWQRNGEDEQDLAGLRPRGKAYRLVSVGQDSQICLWNLEFEEEEPPPFACTTGSPGLRRVNSASHIAVGAHRRTNSGASLALSNSLPPPTVDISNHPPVHNRSSSNLFGLVGGSNRSNGTSGSTGVVVPCVPRHEMVLIPPEVTYRIHLEPLSDVVVLDDCLITSCYSGQLRCWLRPSHEEDNSMEDSSEDEP